MEKLRTINVDKYPLPQMQSQVDKYIEAKKDLIQAGGVKPPQGLIDQDEYREAKGVIPQMDTNVDRGYIPPLSPAMESDEEKFVGRYRCPVSDTVEYRKPINEQQGRGSDFHEHAPMEQESIQKDQGSLENRGSEY